MRNRGWGLKSWTKNPSLSRQKPSRALRESSNRQVAGYWSERSRDQGNGGRGGTEQGRSLLNRLCTSCPQITSVNFAPRSTKGT